MPQPIGLRVTEVPSGKHTIQTAQTASSLIQGPHQTKGVPREKSSKETSVNSPWLVRVWCQCSQGLTPLPLGPRSHRPHLGVQLALSPRALPRGEAKAEARDPMTQADLLPGHSPGASRGAISTNPELSQRTPVPGTEETLDTCHPSPSSKFLELGHLQSLMLPV